MARAASFVLLLCLGFGADRVLGGDVVINEVNYEPLDETLLEEFVEIYNAGGSSVDLSGWYFSEGIQYTFPQGASIAPGAYVVVAESPDAMKTQFGIQGSFGPFDGHLSNDGERLVLRDASGVKQDAVDYGVGFPWPLASAGEGSSLELINPSFDNDLGGNWRPSGPTKALPAERLPILGREDALWHYRKGTSEASDPPTAWRQLDFVEDATWLAGATSIGIGDDDDKTILDDMLGGYTSVYLRHEITIASLDDLPPMLKVGVYVDDGAIVWLNGVEIARTHIAAGEQTFDDVGRTNEARWEEFTIAGAKSILRTGRNVLAVHAFNVNLSSNDFSIDAELFVPARGELPPAPTPAAENSVFSDNAAPSMRQVEASPPAPKSGEPIRVHTKVTDTDGVTQVTMAYQIVPPGGYLPAELPFEPTELLSKANLPRAKNPAFEDPANWTQATLRDDGAAPDEVAGDDVFTGLIPAQPNRTLVRYRITATDTLGLSVTSPYVDDGSLNFACFVYDGLPPYVASKVSVSPDGPGHVYTTDVLNALPVYTLVTRNADIQRCVAYNGSWQLPKSNEAARDAFNWEGAFVYEGVVYDHVRYRLRQANDRYGGSGKRSWRIRFHKGNRFQAKDEYGEPYPTEWRTLNTGKMFDNKAVGNFGLTEPLNTLLWNLVGVPAPFMHRFHFRVIDAADEVPAGVNGQYLGDFWGMALAIEDYDSRFLDAHKLTDGNLYKLKDGIFDGRQLKRNQGRYAVTTDADFQNIRTKLRPTQDEDWLNTYVNYPRWYPYHAVVEGIRHYDFVPADSHSKNRAWFFEPADESPYGRLWTLPWDHDASWGPNWNNGVDYSMNAIFAPPGKPDFKREYRNVLREFRDLVWTEEVINGLIDAMASKVASFVPADRDRWRVAPPEAGTQDFGTMEAKVADMKKFAFVSWSGSTGPAVPAGGRAKYLDTLASAEGDAANIPATPTITYAGPAGYPLDGLVFDASPFSDPQGDGTFGSIEWRLAEISPSLADTSRAPNLEFHAMWQSGPQPAASSHIIIPLTAARPGRTYRVRSRVSDDSGHNSHWSEAIQFVAGEPSNPLPVRDSLRVTEVMYNPVDGGDAEFVELQNVGPGTIDLTAVRFTEGIQFDFAGSAVTTLAPGEYVVVVKSLGIFEERYETGSIHVAGEFDGKLDNEGDEIALVLGEGVEIQRFTFDDSWYPETDGEGYSLVVADSAQPLEQWSQKSGWRRSQNVHGSPGHADGDEPPRGGGQIPGDVTQDAKLSITDPIGILGLLFLGSPAELPCGGGKFEETGNRKLADINGDGQLNLTDPVALLRYLFLGDVPPALGVSCVLIEDCADTCAP